MELTVGGKKRQALHRDGWVSTNHPAGASRDLVNEGLRYVCNFRSSAKSIAAEVQTNPGNRAGARAIECPMLRYVPKEKPRRKNGLARY